jgi:hypothetical protein
MSRTIPDREMKALIALSVGRERLPRLNPALGRAGFSRTFNFDDKGNWVGR